MFGLSRRIVVLGAVASALIVSCLVAVSLSDWRGRGNDEPFADGVDARRASNASAVVDAGSNASASHTRVAVAVLLTSNSRRNEQFHNAVDGMAVLRRSMLAVLPPPPAPQPTFVVMVTRAVDVRWHAVFRQLGWADVRVYDRPLIDTNAIRSRRVAVEILTDGAIGADELIKLDVFGWGDDFDVVMLLDVDVLFHRPFPELMAQTGAALRWTKGGWEAELINGGVLVVEPKGDVGKKHRRAMLDIVLEGDFRVGTGWRGSGIGWTYGGRTVQGVLPYYFLAHLRGIDDIGKASARQRTSRELGDDLQISRCRYNNMDQLPECKALPVEQVTSNHFTGECLKPWWCEPTRTRTRRCAAWVRRWKQLYALELEAHRVLPGLARLVAAGVCSHESLAKALLERLSANESHTEGPHPLRVEDGGP